MYLLRLDDASEHWNIENWHRMHDMVQKYGVKPIVAIIPDNQDSKLLRFPLDPSYDDTIRAWLTEGWTPALHGYSHVMDSPNGGVNPINRRSEFAGKPLEIQQEKIRNGYALLKEKGIAPHVFVAPGHTFDKNTLEALRTETDIRIVSDTIADDVWFENDFYFIPQQSGSVRVLGFTVTTFCYHPNTMHNEGFEKLEFFLREHHRNFGAFGEISLKKRPLNAKDQIVKVLYFAKRRLLTN